MKSPINLITDLDDLEGKTFVKSLHCGEDFLVVFSDGDVKHLARFKFDLNDDLEEEIDLFYKNEFKPRSLHRLGLIDDMQLADALREEARVKQERERKEAQSSIRTLMQTHGITVSDLGEGNA
jgi:predicted nucleotidyltransferase